jgi:ribonuclease BN (tRNA processing enzyme)
VSVEIHFYGTRGYVEEKSRRHRHHAAFVLSWKGFRLLCDFGQTNEGRLAEMAPDAIFISHAHPDHGWGLKEGTDLPVYASAITIEILKALPVSTWKPLEPGRPLSIGPLELTAFPVVHSVRCPCVAGRIRAGGAVLVYSGDLISFEDEEAALSGCDLYVGDGSTLVRPLVRRHPTGGLMGHTTVRAQLGWMRRRRVPRAIFSHFGKGPIEMGDRALREEIRRLAAEKAPECDVSMAYDGAEFALGE